jgi:hypothetical protein
LYHAWSIPLALGSYLIGGAIVGISGYLLTSALGLPWYLSLLAGIGTAYFVLTSSRRLIADRFCPWVFFGSGPESTPLLDWINELAKRDLKTHRAIAFLPTYYFVLNNHIQLIEKYFQIQSQTGKASQFILYKISTGLKLNIPKPSPGNTDNSSLMEEVKQMLLMKKQHLNRMRIELLALINEVYQSEVLDHDRLQDLIVQTRTFLNPD